jgi:hypothetical protein
MNMEHSTLYSHFKKEGGGRGRIMEGMTQSSIQCMHMWKLIGTGAHKRRQGNHIILINI